MSLVKHAVLASHERGERGTLIDEAPPFRSYQHLRALTSKQDNSWEDWCRSLERTISPLVYEGLADRKIRQSIRRGNRSNYDPVPPPVTVPPPTCLPDTRSARCADPQLETLSQ